MNWHEFCIDCKSSKNTVYEQQEGGIKTPANFSTSFHDFAGIKHAAQQEVAKCPRLYYGKNKMTVSLM